MRKLAIFILIMALLALPAAAASGITSAQSQTVVSENGSCRVSITFVLQLEERDDDLRFPLPENAKDISINGASARSSRVGGKRMVSLSRAVSGVGIHTVSIQYTLPGAVVADEKDRLFLELELLSGFSYSVDDFQFTVTLPGPVDATPVFTSTYYQETAASVMHTSFVDGVLTGSFIVRLQDHETVRLSLPVTAQMFPNATARRYQVDTPDLLMLAAAGVAVIYWLIALRCSIPRRSRTAVPPEGITAGELGCQLTARGADLTLMVLSWAQMGYLMIHLEDSGRVLLHKRMEMGNERSEFEIRTFRSLFGRRKIIDGTGYHYARLCRRIGQSRPDIRDNFLPRSGNPQIFRCLILLIGTLSGVSLGIAFAIDTFWQVLLAIFLGALGTAIAWLIQEAACALHTHNKLTGWIALASALLWLLLSIGAGEWNVALCMLPAQYLAGLAAAYGGRRSEAGMHRMSEILGLRHYMRSLTDEDLQRLLRSNPHYYFDIAPYALALGAEGPLTRLMGRRKLPVCSWLTTGLDGQLTAREWSRLLHETVNSLDTLQKRLPLDRLLGK